jgi:hypothetical protein
MSRLEKMMSNATNDNILEVASELIDFLDGTQLADRIANAVERNDLEEVRFLNLVAIDAIAREVA